MRPAATCATVNCQLPLGAHSSSTHFAAPNDEHALVSDLPGEDERAAALDLWVVMLCGHGGDCVEERPGMLRGDAGVDSWRRPSLAQRRRALEVDGSAIDSAPASLI